jgi:hypothetical protein
MTRGPNESADLKLVSELVFASHDLDLQRFSRSETVAGKTPDFRVTRGNRLVAFCEVKSPRDDWLDEQLESTPSGQIVGGARNDPTFNRIARHIQKAAMQFDAVNSSRTVPNILVFVNHATTGHYGDLLETVTGILRTANGKSYVTIPYISEGRIADTKTQIDLYVWIDFQSRRVQGYLCNETVASHMRDLCKMLHLNWPKIEVSGTTSRTVADCEADLEKAFRVFEQARREAVPADEMTIYLDRVEACRDELARALAPEPDPEPPCVEIIDDNVNLLSV